MSNAARISRTAGAVPAAGSASLEDWDINLADGKVFDVASGTTSAKFGLMQLIGGTYVVPGPLNINGGITQTGFTPLYLFKDTSGAINRTRVGVGVYTGDYYIQFQDDIGGYRDNPLLISASTFDATFSGSILPKTDNTKSVGGPSSRFMNAYIATGAVNNSDARLKTPVVPLDAAEIAAAKALVSEIGWFQFLDAVAAKGDGARRHVGMTVQRAIEVMEAHGLDPMAYGFICHDAWTAEPAQDEVRAPVLGDDGEPTGKTYVVRPVVPARPAGERYGFRTDELLLFMAAGFDARLSALEAAAA